MPGKAEGIELKSNPLSVTSISFKHTQDPFKNIDDKNVRKACEKEKTHYLASAILTLNINGTEIPCRFQIEEGGDGSKDDRYVTSTSFSYMTSDGQKHTNTSGCTTKNVYTRQSYITDATSSEQEHFRGFEINRTLDTNEEKEIERAIRGKLKIPKKFISSDSLLYQEEH